MLREVDNSAASGSVVHGSSWILTKATLINGSPKTPSQVPRVSAGFSVRHTRSN